MRKINPFLLFMALIFIAYGVRGIIMREIYSKNLFVGEEAVKVGIVTIMFGLLFAYCAVSSWLKNKKNG